MPTQAVLQQRQCKASLSAASDETLVEGIRRGSEAHFNVLYQRYFQRIYVFVYLRVRNHADAEELTQETFTQVFRSIDGFSGRSSPLAWIYGIAKNTVYNQVRRARARDERMDRAGPEMLVPSWESSADTPEDHLALRRYVTKVVDRLQAVSPWHLEVFVLRHVDDLSIGEIAERTGRSNDAIRSGLYRVKRLMTNAGAWDAAAASP